MTKRLILTRHAKSAWDDPTMADHDRPLNERGHAAAATTHALKRSRASRCCIRVSSDASASARCASKSARTRAPWSLRFCRPSALRSVVVDHLRDLEALLARAPELRRIADLVGRIEAVTRRGPNLERGGRESIVGVTTSGELADVLPSELALLSDPDTEDLFLLRMAERNLLSLEHDGATMGIPSEPTRRGHAIVCVDTSGSMIGEREALAKAATLALVKRVVGGGRRAEVALFGGRGAITSIAFPGRGLRALFDLMMTSYHGGTDFDGVLDWALRRRDALPGADIVVLTDGRGRVSPVTTRRVNAARRAKPALRLVYVTIASPVPNDHDALAAIADEALCIASAASAPRELVTVRSPRRHGG